jgi:hypothetical protein
LGIRCEAGPGITLVALLGHPVDLFVSIHDIARRCSGNKGRHLEAVPALSATWVQGV